MENTQPVKQGSVDQIWNTILSLSVSPPQTLTEIYFSVLLSCNLILIVTSRRPHRFDAPKPSTVQHHGLHPQWKCLFVQCGTVNSGYCRFSGFWTKREYHSPFFSLFSLNRRSSFMKGPCFWAVKYFFNQLTKGEMKKIRRVETETFLKQKCHICIVFSTFLIFAVQ